MSVPTLRRALLAVFFLNLAALPNLYAGDENGLSVRKLRHKPVGPHSPDYECRDGCIFESGHEGYCLVKNSSDWIENGEIRLRLRLASDALDDWMKEAEEYGTITMSAPLLAEPKAHFDFGLNRTADQYFEAAKKQVEGSAVSKLGIATRTRAGFTAQFDPTVAAAFEMQENNFLGEQARFEADVARRALKSDLKDQAAERLFKAEMAAAATISDSLTRAEAEKKAIEKFSEALTTNPDPLTAPEPPVAKTDGTDVPGLPQSDIVKDPKGLADEVHAELDSISSNVLTSAELSVPDRTAIIEAASNSAVQDLFNFLGQPEKAMPFLDKKVIFAVVTVAVNPGWRTKKDFAAEIACKISFEYQKARTDVVKKMYQSGQITAYLRSQGVEEEAMDGRETALLRAHSVELKETIAGKRAAKAKVTAQRGVLEAEKKRQTDLQKSYHAAANKYYAEAEAAIAPLPDLAPPSAFSQGLESFAETQIAAIAPPAINAPKSAFSDLADKIEKVVDDPVLKSNLLQIAGTLNDTKSAAEQASALVENAEKELEAAQEELEKLTEEERLKRPLFDSIVAWRGIKEGLLGSHRLPAPLVAGVAPLMETQALDLADNYRRQDAIAFALAATLRKAGMKGQGQFFTEYVKERRKDVRTRSNNAIANTFSVSGGIFGFQVGPRLKGLADPASRKDGAANILDRQSFPALLIIGMDKDAIAPVIVERNGSVCATCAAATTATTGGTDGKEVKDGKDGKKPKDSKNCTICTGGTLAQIYEPSLRITQTTRWTPLSRKLVSFSGNDWWRLDDIHNPRLGEDDRFQSRRKVSDRLDWIKDWIAKTEKKARGKIAATNQSNASNGGELAPNDALIQQISSPYLPLAKTLVERADTLQTLTSGSGSVQALPVAFMFGPEKQETPKVPQVLEVIPSQITISGATPAQFFIRAKDLSSVVSVESVNPTAMQITAAKPEAIKDGVIVQTTISQGGTTAFILTLESGAKLYTPLVQIRNTIVPELSPVMRSVIKTTADGSIDHVVEMKKEATADDKVKAEAIIREKLLEQIKLKPGETEVQLKGKQ